MLILIDEGWPGPVSWVPSGRENRLASTNQNEDSCLILDLGRAAESDIDKHRRICLLINEVANH